MPRGIDQDAPRAWLFLAGFKFIVSSILISAALSLMASEACARARALPEGSEWYEDDCGFWRSIRDDWRHLQSTPHGSETHKSKHHQRW
jgi:hypothetical protein